MTFHLRLELRDEGEEFAGRAISDSESREFHGWLGLIGAIEALYPDAAPAATQAQTSDEEADVR